MEETNLIAEGFKFMGLGMGTVFIFLIILIISMNIMSKVLNKFFPEVAPVLDSKSSSARKDNKKVIAAITAAIKHHREG